jgi:hypothetical protein
VDFTDWMLFLHVLSAFALVGGLAAFWALVLATRPARSLISGSAAGSFAAPTGAVVGIGTGGTLVFGVILAIDIDGYELWDGWILAAIVLWAIGTGFGQRSGVELTRAGIGAPEAPAARRRGVLLLAGSSLASLIILILMIWKPGA